MASISRGTGAKGTLIRIFFRGVDGERRAIHLGRTPIKVAEEWARKISAIEACLVASALKASFAGADVNVKEE